MLARRFFVIPTATGLTAASRALIAARSSGDGGRLVSQQDGNPLHRRYQIAPARGRKLALALEGS